MNTHDNYFFKELEKSLPPVFSRQEAAKHLGGLIKSKTLSNLDALGKGPAVKVRLNKKIGYVKQDFLNWLWNYKDQSYCNIR